MVTDGYVYLLTNERHSVLYIGVTSNIMRRVYEHKHELVTGFTQRYHVHLLVYYEKYGLIIEAIEREKQLKKWNRAWKEALINHSNPEWVDLSEKWDFTQLTSNEYM